MREARNSQPRGFLVARALGEKPLLVLNRVNGELKWHAVPDGFLVTGEKRRLFIDFPLVEIVAIWEKIPDGWIKARGGKECSS